MLMRPLVRVLELRIVAVCKEVAWKEQLRGGI